MNLSLFLPAAKAKVSVAAQFRPSKKTLDLLTAALPNAIALSNPEAAVKARTITVLVAGLLAATAGAVVLILVPKD